jgi:hypothetical protein
MNIKSETLRLLEENIGKTRQDVGMGMGMGMGKGFLERIQPAQERLPGTDKCMKLRSFCTVRTTASVKQHARVG